MDILSGKNGQVLTLPATLHTTWSAIPTSQLAEDRPAKHIFKMSFTPNHPITVLNQLFVSGLEQLNDNLWECYNELLRYPYESDFLERIQRGIFTNGSILADLKVQVVDGDIPDWNEILRGLSDVAKCFLLHGESVRIDSNQGNIVEFFDRPSYFFRTFERVIIPRQYEQPLPLNTPPDVPSFRVHSPDRYSPNYSPRFSPVSTPPSQHQRHRYTPYPARSPADMAVPQHQMSEVIDISDDSDEEIWSNRTVAI